MAATAEKLTSSSQVAGRTDGSRVQANGNEAEVGGKRPAEGELVGAPTKKECLSADPLPSFGSDQHAAGNCKPCPFVWKLRGCAKGTSCSYCHLCNPGDGKAKAGKRKAEANDRIRKASKHMDDHKLGHATGTSCSERSSIRVCCKDCGSISGPARMGTLGTCYAGTFKCNGCWDAEDEAVCTEKARVSSSVHAPFDYMLVGIDKSPPQRCRLLERNENDTWNIQFKNKKYANDIPGDKLQFDGDCVESLSEFLTILSNIFAKLLLDSPSSRPCVSLCFLPLLIHEESGKCLVPKKLGHQKQGPLMKVSEVAEKFIVQGSNIYEAHPTCNEGLKE